jgi:integrase
MVRMFGGGSVYPKKVNGVIVGYRASRSVDHNGKRRQIKGNGRDEDTAVKRMERNMLRYLVAIGEEDQKVLLANSKEIILYKEWLDDWLTSVKQSGSVQSNTLVRYKGAIEQHIKPHIGDTPIRLIDEKQLRKLLFETLPAKRKTKKNSEGIVVTTGEQLLGNSPIRKIYDILNVSLREAANKGMIARNPMDSIARIAKSEQKEEGLDRLTWIPLRLMERLHDTGQAHIWVLAFYGLRQAERLGLEHSSFTYIDNPKKPTELLLNRQLTRDEETGKLFIKRSTKTKAGMRKVILPDEVSDILRRYKKAQAEWKLLPTWKPDEGLEDLFFTTPAGKPIRHQTDNKRWQKLLAENNIAAIRAHSMRHVTATLLARSGTHPDVAKTILGHSSAAMTSYYTHLNASDTALPMTAITNKIFGDWRKKEAKLLAVGSEGAENLDLTMENDDSDDIISALWDDDKLDDLVAEELAAELIYSDEDPPVGKIF